MKRRYKIAMGLAIAGVIILAGLFIFQSQPPTSFPITYPPPPPEPEPVVGHPCSNLPDWAHAWGARLKFGC